MSERAYYKYNEEDILEILTEYLAKESGYSTFSTKGIILGTPGKDLRLLVAVSSLEDNGIDNINLKELDEKLQFNGSHNENYYVPSKKLFKSIDDAIKKGDF